MSILECKALTKSYGAREALKSVDLTIEPGHIVGLLGPNGSGKTTFIKLLCRLYDPTEGVILLNGIDIRKYRYDEYMDIFSVVFQDFRLLALPLGQNVAARTGYDAPLFSGQTALIHVVGQVEVIEDVFHIDAVDLHLPPA